MRAAGTAYGSGPRGWVSDVRRPRVCTGKVKKELDADDSHLSLDETAKLLRDLQEAQAERGGSRPPSNLSSLSNPSPSDRDPHHPGKARHPYSCTPAGRRPCLRG